MQSGGDGPRRRDAVPSPRRWAVTTTALVATASVGAALAGLRARGSAATPSDVAPTSSDPGPTAAPPPVFVAPAPRPPVPSLLSARPAPTVHRSDDGRTYLYAAVVPPTRPEPVRRPPEEEPGRSVLATAGRTAGKVGLLAAVVVAGVLVPTGPAPERQEVGQSWPAQALARSGALLELQGTEVPADAVPALALAAAEQPVAAAPIPSPVLAAYHEAAREVNAADPECRLSWSVLAGIGAMESRHGAAGGSMRAGWSGVAEPPILGPVLDGSRKGMARIADTDRGRYDGHSAYDRAVGPMQFLPGTWVAYGLDAAGNGDPQNIRDAARAAGRYLCAGTGDLSDPAQLAQSVYRYNRADWYVRAVLAGAAGYLAASYGPGPEGVAMASIAFAYARLGDPYQWGGTGPLYDCSGLTQAAFRSAGVSLPRTAAMQWRALPPVSPGDLRVGDLVFSEFGAREPGAPGHVGIYLGAGKIVNAPYTGEFIRISPVPGGEVQVRRPAALAVGSGAPLPGTGFAITVPTGSPLPTAPAVPTAPGAAPPAGADTGATPGSVPATAPGAPASATDGATSPGTAPPAPPPAAPPGTTPPVTTPATGPEPLVPSTPSEPDPDVRPTTGDFRPTRPDDFVTGDSVEVPPVALTD